MSLIPKRLGHIWIGPLLPPTEWMATWKDKHPEWEYALYDNAYLQRESFRTRPQINEYMRRGDYHGVADLMRYEILYKVGGFIAAADSECLHPIDELLEGNHTLYTVYENEFARGKLVSPIQAATPEHPFLDLLISELSRVPPECLDVPWKQTGNLFLARMIDSYQPKITIWPSHYLIPEHFLGLKYQGSDKIYARQRFGTTNSSYKHSSPASRVKERLKKLYARRRLSGLSRARTLHGFAEGSPLPPNENDGR